MRFFRDLDHVGLSTGSAVTVGNFDGLHLGHRELLKRCRECAGADGEVALVTFQPLPREWFDPAGAPSRLVGVDDKLRLLEEAGVDLVWMLRFNDRLASMPAREFVERVLVAGLAAHHVVLGGDFRFGRGREGDIGLMQQLGEELGFAVEVVESVELDGERVSSTRVRDALIAGDLDRAARLLGRPYTISGRVIPGKRLGRQLGYPTANVRPPGLRTPLGGIFAVRARVEDGPWRGGVASLGHRPAVGGKDVLLEVHLFDFAGDLYGRRLETHFIAKLRDEQHFDGLEALVAQMRKDEARARALLAGAGNE